MIFSFVLTVQKDLLNIFMNEFVGNSPTNNLNINLNN